MKYKNSAKMYRVLGENILLEIIYNINYCYHISAIILLKKANGRFYFLPVR